MERKLKNKTMAVLAGAVMASAAVNSNASERQPLQLEVRTEQSAVQYNANKEYVNPLVDKVIMAKRGEDNFIRTSYTSGSVNLSLSENNRLIASTEYKILYPLLYDQHVGPYVFTAIQDTRYGHFRNATQFLYVASEKAKSEGNKLAVDEMNLAYTYMRLAEETGSYNAGNVSVNKASAKALTNTFIQRSKIIYEIAHRKLVSNNVSTKYSQNSQISYNKDSNGEGLLDVFVVAGMVIFAIGVLPYAVIFGIEWTFDKCMPNRKTMTGPTTTISEDTDNNRSRRREEYSYNQSNAQSLYDAARREERIQNRADMCEDGRCGHPWHQK